MAVTATHQFKCCYSKTKDLRSGKNITSPAFSVAGHNCNILYYPQGSKGNSIKLDLALHCKSEVTASFGFIFLDKHGMPSSKASDRLIFTFSPSDERYGFMDFIEKSHLEAEFVKDDYFTLVCSVTILSNLHKQVPKQLVNGIVPFTINEHFVMLLEKEDMTDITFEVGEEIFAAHRLVLSARSPVFKAELFGEMVESKMKSIQIKDIKPVVFNALLHFIYTDSLPEMSDEDIPIVTLFQYLFEAADIYALDGMKIICAERLILDLSVDTVTSTLALAEEHDCSDLKDACLYFASEPENLIQLALKAEYVHLMQRNPSLLEEFGDLARDNIGYSNLISKKQDKKKD
ncbi:BTB/POZ and MATH domain-containing protein 2 [Rhynchospora pubera]|uniref:BTB/POZ and MATH domain-containing protein 2 n=1 Tax=Rhynchospora pubera TaxID=906938 RepID=A0AAV8HCD1_9POAL|nr:BTB/POZ and MATH domain-containing protein 2 [Rhynchospora pubera]